MTVESTETTQQGIEEDPQGQEQPQGQGQAQEQPQGQGQAPGEERQSEEEQDEEQLGLALGVGLAAGLILTAVAAAKVKSLLEQQGEEGLSLRVAVQPGGCSGLRYQLFFDDRSMDGDVESDFDGVTVVTDRMSAPYLAGASIDYVDTIEKQGFTIDNPNATGSCACGDSFN